MWGVREEVLDKEEEEEEGRFLTLCEEGWGTAEEQEQEQEEDDEDEDEGRRADPCGHAGVGRAGVYGEPRAFLCTSAFSLIFCLMTCCWCFVSASSVDSNSSNCI